MKLKRNNILGCLGMLFSIFILTSAVAQENKIKTVDVEKIRKDAYTKFVDHIFWYPKEVVNNKKISKKLIPEDMDKFKDMIKKVIKPEYIMSENIFDSNSFAVENLRDANDYILLEYRNKKLKIQIQDGKALYLSILPDEDLKIEQSNLTQYVKSVAFQIMTLPKLDEKKEEPRIFVSNLDIGNSKCGRIYYNASFPPPKFWYSSIRWWSDGRNILFLIGRGRFDGKDLSKRARQPKDALEPRKFEKLKKEQ